MVTLLLVIFPAAGLVAAPNLPPRPNKPCARSISARWVRAPTSGAGATHRSKAARQVGSILGRGRPFRLARIDARQDPIPRPPGHGRTGRSDHHPGASTPPHPEPVRPPQHPVEMNSAALVACPRSPGTAASVSSDTQHLHQRMQTLGISLRTLAMS